MANIFARSPYLIRVAEAGQNGSKVELFIKNTGSFTTLPQYTLSKLIPASNQVETLYDISPYIQEYIKFLVAPPTLTNIATNPTAQRCDVRVKRYKLLGATYTLLDTTDYLGFDGYTYYESGYNFDLGNYALDQKNKYYYNPTNDAGIVRVTTGASFTARYTNLSTAVVTSLSIPSSTYNIPRVLLGNQNDGNKLEILNSVSAVQATWNFYPQEECKYVPVIIDFVNKYGAYQREFFFKASNDTMSIENTEYNLLQSDSYNYNVIEGQRRMFNTNGKKSIKVNTGWVEENWSDTLKQIMLSEKILIDSKPAKINTKSTELFKNINTKQINYSLDFEFAYDVINSII